MTYSFDGDTAKVVGVQNAVVLQHVAFWVRLNETNQSNEVNGKHWTYNSVKGFSDYFSFLTERQIRHSLDTLVSDGYLEVGVFNKNPYDRTRWFTLTDKARELLKYGQHELPDVSSPNYKKCQMATTKSVEPIPDNIPDINQINTIPPLSNTLSNERLLERPPEGALPQKSAQRKFVPPKLEEVADYCRERGNAVNASQFVDYYTSVGWKVGKQSMKDWKAAVRTWERRDASSASSKAKEKETYRAPVFVGYDEEGRGIYE